MFCFYFPLFTNLYKGQKILSKTYANKYTLDLNYVRTSFRITMTSSFSRLLYCQYQTQRPYRPHVSQGRAELITAIEANQRSAELWQPYLYGHWQHVHEVCRVIRTMSDRQPVVSLDELHTRLDQQLGGQPAILDGVLTMLYNWVS